MKYTTAAVMATSFLVAACGSKTDANEKNFGAAMSQYMEKKGAQCLRGQKWPVDFPPMTMKMHERQPLAQVTQMASQPAERSRSGATRSLMRRSHSRANKRAR